MKFPSSAFVLLVTCGTIAANPAVSDTNGKIGMTLGDLNSESVLNLEGSIAWPIRDHFGFQLDALYSNNADRPFGFNQSDDEHTGGIGAHYFWRDSETALIGLQGGYITSEPADSWEFGIEAERYLGAFTLGGKTGIASIDVDSSIPPFAQDDEDFYFQFYLGFYPIDDLWIAPTVEHRFDNTLYGVEIEYELPARGWSVFANAMLGENNYQQTFVGMRYYFDDNKPLKLRHRESDPKIQLQSMQSGIALHQAAAAKRWNGILRRYLAEIGHTGSGGTLQISNSASTYLAAWNTNFINSSGGSINQNPLGGSTGFSSSLNNSVISQGLTDPSIFTLTLSNGNVYNGTMTLDNRARIHIGNNSYLTTNILPPLPPGGSYIFLNGMYVLNP